MAGALDRSFTAAAGSASACFSEARAWCLAPGADPGLRGPAEYAALHSTAFRPPAGAISSRPTAGIVVRTWSWSRTVGACRSCSTMLDSAARGDACSRQAQSGTWQHAGSVVGMRSAPGAGPGPWGPAGRAARPRSPSPARMPAAGCQRPSAAAWRPSAVCAPQPPAPPTARLGLGFGVWG